MSLIRVYGHPRSGNNMFSGEDLDYFYSLVPRDHWGLWER